MHIVFRADASLRLGTGHVMRCLTLADRLSEGGASCRFVSRTHPGHLHALIEAHGHEVEALDLMEVRNDWLGADWTDDAAETTARLAKQPTDWLVVDHYGIDSRWEARLRGDCGHVMAIDDLADRQHDCDVLLDQNWFAEAGAYRYNALVPPVCELLLGPAYALLRPEYAAARACTAPRDGRIRRIAVFMGGSDPDNQTAKVLDALSYEAFASLTVDVIVGVNHPDPEGVARRVAQRPLTTSRSALPSLAGIMRDVDLMIGAGGSTTWERMALGLPAIVIGIADNQLVMNRTLAAAGYIDYLGAMDVVDVSTIRRAVTVALTNPVALAATSARMMALVSTDGAKRVAETLFRLNENAVTSAH